MTRRQIDVRLADSTASADAVFALLADGTTWPNWAPIDSFELERAGDPPPEGVGAIRVFKRGRVTGRDEIVELVPGSRLGYVSISGLAIKDYRATVDVGDAGDDTGGAVIRWRASFFPKIPRHRSDPPPRHSAGSSSNAPTGSRARPAQQREQSVLERQAGVLLAHRRLGVDRRGEVVELDLLGALVELGLVGEAVEQLA